MKSALIALALCLLAAAPHAARAEDAFTLVHATDLHYIAQSLTDNGAYFTAMVENADGKVMQKIEAVADAFISRMLDIQPGALILSGDLTFNGAKASHEALAQKLGRLADAGIPVYVIPGNHDLCSRSAARFEGDGYTLVESVTPQEFERIYSRFGFSAALERDAQSLSYAAQLAPGLRLLMLDVNTPGAPGALTASALAFARAQLEDAAAAGDRVIAVSHQNLLQHNPLFSAGFVIEDCEPLLALYQEAGVSLTLSGHMHTQHRQTSGSVTEIAASALSVSPNQYGVLRIDENGIACQTQALNVAAWARACGSADPQLLDFAAYSEAFFKSTTLRQAAGLFQNPEEAKRLGGYLAEVNACYFSGRMDLAPQNSALYDRWLAQGAFFSSYLTSIFAEPPADHTRTHIAF